jgi:acetyl-CoA C-acetyltransferase
LREAAIIGVGTTPVTAGSGRSLSELFVDAAIQAIDDAGVDKIDSIYVGNMMSGFLQNQEHLGALMATALGRRVSQLTRSKALVPQAASPLTQPSKGCFLA